MKELNILNLNKSRFKGDQGRIFRFKGYQGREGRFYIFCKYSYITICIYSFIHKY